MIRTQKSAKHRYYIRYLAQYTKRNYSVFILAVIFLLGVAAGTLLIPAAAADTLELLLRLVGGFVEKRMAGTLASNFISALCSSMMFVAVLFVCGFCAIAQPLEMLIPFFRGLGFGFSISCLYVGYGARAVGFVALYILPGMLLSTIAVLLCSRESLRFSRSFFSLMCSGDKREELYSLNIYLARYFAASFLCVFSALLEAVIYAVFANYVVLG